MEKISKAIKCTICKKILTNPVILPCCHNVCQSHVTGKKSIQCGECALEHQVPKSGEFLLNKSLIEIIETQIGALDFGGHHKLAKHSCNSLEDEIRHIDLILNDPENVTYEVISKLKNKMILKSEQLKLKIEQETNKVVAELDDYQKRCKGYLKSKQYAEKFGKLQGDKKAAEKEHEKWIGQLNLIKFDEKQWDAIKEKSDQKIAYTKEQVSVLESDLLLNERDEKVSLIDFFDQININSVFFYRYIFISSFLAIGIRYLVIFLFLEQLIR